MWFNFFEVAIVGGVLCLDKVFLQAMISRPVVIGPLIGILLSEPLTGLIIGAFIELLWIDRSPMGLYVPPNDSVVAVLATAGAILAGKESGPPPHELMTLSILLFLPLGILVQRYDVWIIKTNEILSQRAIEFARVGDIQRLAREHMQGLIKTFVGAFVVIFVSLVPGVAILKWLFPILPERFLHALSYIYFFIPLLGIAVALSTIKLRGTVPVFAGFFLLITLIMKIC
ncbi:MAG TPA: PTS sugar transporter subunit IIC [Syntrophales bacterium]|nr:PTS sugar transporter subunit IIC [Syntrophales bacterium]HPQ45099.1 PTS sugar transporter subunit IIC [Syntrophales bacterium]